MKIRKQFFRGVRAVRFAAAAGLVIGVTTLAIYGVFLKTVVDETLKNKR